jgi:putative ABC transport system permease protein
LLRERRRVRDGAPDDFRVRDMADFIRTRTETQSILSLLLGATAAISLVVGGIGIMNIMLVSVTERTREIGLRKALGARRQTIMQQFLIEAVVLTTVGGLLGLLLAIGVLHLVVAVVPFLGQVVINPWTLVVALLVSVLTGVTFGVWPASRAASLSPIEALRQE